jgi:hypothetical protein
MHRAGWDGGQHEWQSHSGPILGAAAKLRHMLAESIDRAGCLAYQVGRDERHVELGQMGGHRPKKIAGTWPTWLLQCCKDRAFTLRGLVGELAERGLRVDYRVVCRSMHAEKLTYKKKTLITIAQTSHGDAHKRCSATLGRVGWFRMVVRAPSFCGQPSTRRVSRSAK